MDKKKTNIEWRILKKAASNQLDKQEQVLFEEWLNANQRNQIYFNKAKQFYQDIDKRESSKDYRDAFKQFERQISTKRSIVKSAMQIAASIVIILGVSWLAYFLVNIETYQKISEADLIKANSSKVELLLSSGETIVLDHEEEKTIQINGGDIKSKLGEIEYLDVDVMEQQKVVYNTLLVPRGANYKLVLSDSTVVWLNAESSIKYPIKFLGDKRQVAITGEAYFDVTPDKSRPFIVETLSTNVEVLGTEFNVNAYDTDGKVYTTLVEGSVAVDNQFGKSLVIVPNEQAVTGRFTDIMVKEANLKQVLGWRNGLFVFEDKTLDDILTELSRWYDFKVFFEEEELKAYEFTGELDQYKDVNQLLLKFEKTRAVEFMVKENVLLVKKPDNK